MNWKFFIFAILWIAFSAAAAFLGGRHWYFVFCMTPGFLLFNGIRLAVLRRRKEWLAWCERKDKGVPVGEAVQKEILKVRDELKLPYHFPFED